MLQDAGKTSNFAATTSPKAIDCWPAYPACQPPNSLHSEAKHARLREARSGARNIHRFPRSPQFPLDITSYKLYYVNIKMGLIFVPVERLWESRLGFCGWQQLPSCWSSVSVLLGSVLPQFVLDQLLQLMWIGSDNPPSVHK